MLIRLGAFMTNVIDSFKNVESDKKSPVRTNDYSGSPNNSVQKKVPNTGGRILFEAARLSKCVRPVAVTQLF